MMTGEYFMTQEERKRKQLMDKLQKQKLKPQKQELTAPDIQDELDKEQQRENRNHTREENIDDLKKKFMKQGTKKVKLF